MALVDAREGYSQAIELQSEAVQFSEATTGALQGAHWELNELFSPENNGTYNVHISAASTRLGEALAAISNSDARVVAAGKLFYRASENNIGDEVRRILEIETELNSSYQKLTDQSTQVQDMIERLTATPAVRAGGIIEFILVDLEKMTNTSGELTATAGIVIPLAEEVLAHL